MLKSAALFVGIFGALAPFILIGQDISQGASSQLSDHNVDVKSVVKVFLAKDKPALLISYTYNFPRYQSIYIKGIGTVPPKGDFEYVTTERQVELRDRADGDLLARVPLQETIIVAATPPILPTPELKDFPKESKPFYWVSSASLPERAQIVLNKYFHLVADPDCSEGMFEMRTTFTPLDMSKLSSAVTAQVALLILYPCKPPQGKYLFQIKTQVMEGRTHSDDFRLTTNYSITHAADTFVQNLVAEMNGLEVK